MKKLGFEWGDIIVIEISYGKGKSKEIDSYTALIEETGRLSVSDECPYKTLDEIPDCKEVSIKRAGVLEIRTLIRELLEQGRLLHYGFDTVNKPAHYADSNIECIDAMEAAFGTEKVMDFCLCNSFKYIWRSQKKNGLEDLKKAMWYENKYLELEKKLRENA